MPFGNNSYLSIFLNLYEIFQSVIVWRRLLVKKHILPISVFEGPKSKLLKEKKISVLSFTVVGQIFTKMLTFVNF